eukprot:COSAG02_NODE_1591_length_11781_cov_861.345403_2_plen_341_part_00
MDILGCPGCRYCEWLPKVTRQQHGCPARDVTSAVVQAVQSTRRQKNKRRRECKQSFERCAETREGASAASGGGGGDGDGSDNAGCSVFCDEYSQSVRGVDAALLCKAGGAQRVLHCMWDSLPTQRRATYTAFAQRHGLTFAPLDAQTLHVVNSSPQAKRRLEYWSASENWKALEPHFKSKQARALWLPAMCQLWLQRRSSCRGDQTMSTESVVTELMRLPGTPGRETDLLPMHLEAIDWRESARKRLCQASEDGNEAPCSRQYADPPFWGWVCGGACHSLVPLYVWIVQQVDPTAAWRVITSDAHSTVWDGGGRLFDPIFEAMGVEATEAFRRAGGGEDL